MTCHGSHGIKKASIDIINEQLCTRCHSYDRAKVMKQALSVVESRIRDTEEGIKALRRNGMVMEADEKEFFRVHAEFRALFHTTDVGLVKDRTEEFRKHLEKLQQRLSQYFHELNFRRNYSIFLMLLFLGISAGIYAISRDKEGS